MKIIIAPDSFKGSLSAKEVSSLVACKAKENFPNAEILEIPIADGGEGTLEALMNNLDLEEINIPVTGPDFDTIHASYAKSGDTAYIEMAKESGICLSKKHSARLTTSQGFGEAIAHALSNGARKLYLAIGGSATNDGGMGMLCALGVRFFDENEAELEGMGENLAKIRRIDASALMPELKNAACYIICDVQNPLLGKDGATLTYGAQKGATEAELTALENGMENFADCAEKEIGKTLRFAPGAGAAGGVGFALLAFANAEFCPGIETVLDIVGFNEKVRNANLVITGEGKMDRQSAFGKAPVGVAMRSNGVPVVAMVGAIGEGFEAVYEKGISSVFSVYSDAVSLEYAMENAADMMKKAADRMLKTIKVGMNIK